MQRGPLVILFSVIAITGAIAGESRVDGALLAAARRAFPREVATNELVRVLQTGLWNSNRTAVAVSVPRPRASLIFVFLQQTHGTYRAVDVSGVEGGNFGVLGRPRT